MARVSDVIEGLSIIAQALGDDPQMGGADHDVIFAPCLQGHHTNLTADARRRLLELGWRRDDLDYSDNSEEDIQAASMIPAAYEVWRRYV